MQPISAQWLDETATLLNRVSPGLVVADLAKMNFIAAGGTHHVYRDPARPDEVLKVFNLQLAPAEVAAMFDCEEFSPYLSGKSKLHRATLRQGEQVQQGFVVLQPFCHDLKHIVAPITISYWEIAHAMPVPLSAGKMFDPEDIIRNFTDMEPTGALMLATIRNDRHLSKLVVHFLDSVTAYVKRTGCILDFVGENNAIIVARGGNLLVEAINITKGDSFSNYASSLRQMEALPDLNETAQTRSIVDVILNTHAFVRMMIVLGYATGYGCKLDWPVAIAPRRFDLMMRLCTRSRDNRFVPSNKADCQR